MSEPNDKPDVDRDELEGRYVQADPENPGKRTVQGEYTRSADDPDPEPDVEASYTTTESNPDETDASERHGKFTRGSN